MSESRLETWFPARRDGFWLVAVIAVMWLSTPFLGVWEPWEADQATIIDLVKQDQTWLQVRLPTGKGDTFRQVAELPFGFWPALASTAVLGTSEIALRLPGLALGLGVLLLLFGTTRRFFGRAAAWFAVLGLLTMPLFTYHARLALGGGGSTAFIALGCLAFLRAASADEKSRWRWLAWASTAAAGLVGGVPALLAPIAVGATVCWTRTLHTEDRSIWRWVFSPVPMGIALAAVAVGWWRASVYMPENATLASLLLWTDPLSGAVSAAKRPTFEAFVHQIGFGLFPLGALVPLAFADLLWHPERDDEPAIARWAPPALAAWFAACFLGPALGAPYGHLALFTGAPVVALVVGTYFARVLRSPPQPLLALAAVILIALLDSNMKHETHFLADAMVGAKVDAFPPQLAGWRFARLLDFALLGVLLVYQGGLRRLLKPAALLFYPSERPPVFSLPRLVGAAAITGIVFLLLRDQFDALVQLKRWHPMKMGARMAVVVIVTGIAFYGLLFAGWWLWSRRLASRPPVETARRLTVRFAAWLEALVEWRPLRSMALLGVLLGWGLFQNIWVAHALTDNFSQKGITEAYSSRAEEDEPLYKYKVNVKNSTFYTRDLEALTSKAFKAAAKDDGRFFAIIPRDQLARVNSEFRKATTNTLPVLDDRSFRFLLVSNRLGEGDEDRNPITRALVPQLPGDAHKVAHVFRERKNGKDAIQLVGWKMIPERPSAGSPLQMILYWKVLKGMRSDWKVFVHLDAAGQRIHGDHDPVGGLYLTSDWTEGDLIADEHRIVVKRTISRAQFTFYVGLYRGSTRMHVQKGAKDKDNRARLGTVRVR